MTSAYSWDLRDRVIAAVEIEGLSRYEAARRYRSAMQRRCDGFRLREDRRGPLAQGGDRRSRLKGHRAWLLADLTLLAVAERLSAEHGVKADAEMLSRFFTDNGVSCVKKR